MSKWVIHRSIFWTQSIDLDSPAHSPLASNKMIPLVCQHGVPFTSWLLQQAANERQSHLKEATMATHLSVTAPLPADCPATSPPPPPPSADAAAARLGGDGVRRTTKAARCASRWPGDPVGSAISDSCRPVFSLSGQVNFYLYVYNFFSFMKRNKFTYPPSTLR